MHKIGLGLALITALGCHGEQRLVGVEEDMERLAQPPPSPLDESAHTLRYDCSFVLWESSGPSPHATLWQKVEEQKASIDSVPVPDGSSEPPKATLELSVGGFIGRINVLNAGGYAWSPLDFIELTIRNPALGSMQAATVDALSEERVFVRAQSETHNAELECRSPSPLPHSVPPPQVTVVRPNTDPAPDSESVSPSQIEGMLPIEPLELTPLTDPLGVGAQALEPAQKAFFSAAEYEAHFGHAAPDSVDFEAGDAVLFYSAGIQKTGGHLVSIGLAYMSWGNAIVVLAQHASPGPGCEVTQATDAPYTLVKVRAPKAESARWSESAYVTECVDPLPTDAVE